MCGPFREILIAHKKAAVENRGSQHFGLCLTATTRLLRCFLLGGRFFRRLLDSFLCGLLGRLLRCLLASFLLGGRFLRCFLGSFLFRRGLLGSSLGGSAPARRRRGRAGFGCDFRFGFVHFHFFDYDCGFRFLFFLFFFFIFLVFEGIAIGTITVVIHLIVATTVERFIECHVILMLPGSAIRERHLARLKIQVYTKTNSAATSARL